MSTTDEIMAMVEECCISLGCDHNKAFAELRTAIEQLVEQANWAHHTPALLSEADAAADLAGVARPGAEPLAWIRPSGKAMLEAGGYCTVYASEGMSNYSIPLYTAPPQASQPCDPAPDGVCKALECGNHAAEPAQQPLTDEQISKIASRLERQGDTMRQFARAIEQAHGIGAAQKGIKE